MTLATHTIHKNVLDVRGQLPLWINVHCNRKVETDWYNKYAYTTDDGLPPANRNFLKRCRDKSSMRYELLDYSEI